MGGEPGTPPGLTSKENPMAWFKNADLEEATIVVVPESDVPAGTPVIDAEIVTDED
ncbi:hypothetical protein SGPA1_100016 [Streptomyces misionensis JCM 4497]